MKVAKYACSVLLILFVGLTFFPVKQFYRFDYLLTDSSEVNTRQIIEVPKVYSFLPGRKSLWALRTDTGYEVYTDLSHVGSEKKIFLKLSKENLEGNCIKQGISSEIEKSIKNLITDNYDSFGNTPLLNAVYKNDANKVKSIVKAGANVDQFNKDKDFNPLLLSVTRKNLDPEIIEILLSNGADVNSANKDGYFALPLLAHRNPNNIAAAKLLLQYGADVNALTNHVNFRGPYNDYSKGESALLLAADKLPGDLAMLLIENGADINIKHQDNKTLLFGVKDTRVAKYLLDNGLDPNAKDSLGRTPLFFSHNAEMVRLFLNYGADIEAKSNSGSTAIFSAGYRWERLREVRLALIAEGANLHLKNNYGKSLLWEVEDPVVYEELLKKGLSPKDIDRKGRTLLHHICIRPTREGHEKIIELLVAYGADVNAMDYDGMRPLDYEKRKGAKRNALIKHGAIAKNQSH